MCGTICFIYGVHTVKIIVEKYVKKCYNYINKVFKNAESIINMTLGGDINIVD